MVVTTNDLSEILPVYRQNHETYEMMDNPVKWRHRQQCIVSLGGNTQYAIVMTPADNHHEHWVTMPIPSMAIDSITRCYLHDNSCQEENNNIETWLSANKTTTPVDDAIKHRLTVPRRVVEVDEHEQRIPKALVRACPPGIARDLDGYCRLPGLSYQVQKQNYSAPSKQDRRCPTDI